MPLLSAEPCDIHEMAYCAICAGHDKPAPVRATGATISASRGGKCAHCGDGFDEGDRISHSTDAGGWIIESHATSGF